MTFALTKVEPYWNVKNGESLDVFTPADIKVEPYWNVKASVTENVLAQLFIKVEPYWNVKKEWKRQINNALELKQNHIGM